MDYGSSPKKGRYDTLAGESAVRLFGRPMYDIRLADVSERNEAYGPRKHDANNKLPPRATANDFLVAQLKEPDAGFARIHTFSYQNQFFELAKPAMFLVHGNGIRVEYIRQSLDDGRYLKKMPPPSDRSGVSASISSFAPDIRMWLYDRADFTIRLDSETGTFDRVLLDLELGGAVGSGSMHAGDFDDVQRPRPRSGRARRWHSSGD